VKDIEMFSDPDIRVQIDETKMMMASWSDGGWSNLTTWVNGGWSNGSYGWLNGGWNNS